MTWLTIYRSQYRKLLDWSTSGQKRGLQEGLYCRAEGFELIFEQLERQRQSQYHVVETGTLRNPGNWKDGQSAKLFTEFVEYHDGSVRSVDIDPQACAAARQALVSDKFTVSCSDSVSWLQGQPDLDKVSLFYLDSWDVKWHNDSASAEHHLKEFQAIEPFLRSGSLVAIDDNAWTLQGQRCGKGRKVVEYLASKNIQPLYDRYQIIYQF